MHHLHVKNGDNVLILSGREKGKQGKVIQVSPSEGKVIIEKRNMVSKHLKPRKAGDASGIVKAEAAMYACKVQIVCPKCNKPTRPIFKKMDDGRKSRVCRKCEGVF